MSTTRPSRPTTTTHVAAPARTDVTPAAPLREPAPPGVAPGTLRLLGAGLAAGSVAYGVTYIVNPDADTSFAIDLVGIGFQLGLFALLAAMWLTRATGTSRLARGMLVVEAAVLGLATIQSVLAAMAMGGPWGTAATVLDLFWPISMLGMAIIGVKVAVAGRWRGALRVWPVVAESWFFVVVAASMVLSHAMTSYVGGGHFILGYGVLGLLLLVRPELTRR